MILTGRIYGRQKERKKCKRRKIKKMTGGAKAVSRAKTPGLFSDFKGVL